MKVSKKLNVVELYAGTGRAIDPFRESPNWNAALLVDISDFARETYILNYPEAAYAATDLSKVSASWIRANAGGQVDVLLGCPPCQGFSDNGRRCSRDHRNRHLRAFGRFAVDLKPKAIAMENVPLAAGARAFHDFTRLLEKANYRWTAGILNAALYGSAQCRQRLIFIAVHESVGCVPVLPTPSHGGRRRYFNYNTRRFNTLSDARTAILGINPATFRVRDSLPHIEKGFGTIDIPNVGEILSGLPKLGSPAAVKLGHVPWEHTYRQLRRMSNISEGGQCRIFRSFYASSYGRLHRRGLARTITGAFPNAGSGRYWHPTQNRSLTLREAARLQGFDDSFRFLPQLSAGTMLVGNALDRALAEVAFDVIKQCLL